MAKYNTLHRGIEGANQIRGISPTNKRIDDYLRAANKFLGDRVENWVLDIFSL